MANFNRVILLGNLTRDPQLRYLPNQTAVVDFGLAVNRKFRGSNGEEREDVLFIDCSAFGKPAEIINQYCQKGRPIFIEGRLKLDTWDDKQTGAKRSKHAVVVENFQLLGGRDGGGGRSSGGDDQRAERSAPRGNAGSGRPAPEPPFDDSQQFKEDDIPF